MWINATSNKTWEEDDPEYSDVFRNDTYTDNVDIKYVVIPSILIFLCTIAVIINVRILVSTKWIRRPLSSTLFMSVSLALADAITAGLLATGLAINSLLRHGFRLPAPNGCVILTVEAVRLACILITMIHLLALACHHYLGIVCPLRSMQWMTHTNVTVIVITIWIAPIAFLFVYFSSFEDKGFQAGCHSIKTIDFLMHQQFRGIYSALISIPLIIMVFIYCHISVVIRKHQASRRWYNRHSRHGRSRDGRNDEQQQLDRNLKALWTTLLILSSYLFCFMPAVLNFCLICFDCVIRASSIKAEYLFIMGCINNFLLIIKPLLNPLIYASRMHEIRVATRRMNDSCRRLLYPFAGSRETNTLFTSGSIRRTNCSIASGRHIGNGSLSRSLRRRHDDVTTEL